MRTGCRRRFVTRSADVQGLPRTLRGGLDKLPPSPSERSFRVAWSCATLRRLCRGVLPRGEVARELEAKL